MPKKLTSKTLPQLRALNHTQKMKEVTDWLEANCASEKKLIAYIWNTDTEAETVWNDTVRTYRGDGQIESESTTERDIETAAQVSRKTVTWTYYAGGQVDTIVLQTRDASDAVISTKTIKHYTDGRQPEVS